MFPFAAEKKRRCASSPSTHTTTTHQTSAPTVRNGNSRVSPPPGDAHVRSRISQQIMSEGGIMSRKFYVILGTLSLMLVSSTAQAQSLAAKVSVPFAFAASQTVFPAGEYRIMTMSPGRAGTLLISGEGRRAFILPTEERSISETGVPPKLVFNQYGGRYFLSEIWLSGAGVICKVHRSDLEIRLAGMPVSKRHLAKMIQKTTDDR